MQSEQELLGPTWVDDYAIFLMEPSSMHLLFKVALVVDLLSDIAADHGLTVNFKPGKTEFMASL